MADLNELADGGIFVQLDRGKSCCLPCSEDGGLNKKAPLSHIASTADESKLWRSVRSD